ncbi:MAG: DUF11 domain-containing protein, partial [Betaproteobacteria bacterium]|nr:DUF11 domain-containing protein [Betaproteobacteria bacterium]
GQKICLIVKQFVPAGAISGALNNLLLSAGFTYSNAAPALAGSVAATDVTTAGQAGVVALYKQVSNVTQGGPAATTVNASAGDLLQYTLIATNNGSQAISTLAINDATPAFTTFQGLSCPTTLPAGLTGCAITAQPATGAVGSMQWTFSGQLSPGSQVSVTYRVQVSP